MNTLVLTANRRLASHLTQTHGRSQLRKNQTVWPNLMILPMDKWIAQCWDEHCPKLGWLLLNTWQEQALWASILQQSPYREHILHLSTTAETLQSAWNLSKSWLLNAPSDSQCSEEVAVFHDLTERFIAHCKAHHFITFVQVQAELIEAVDRGLIPLPARIILTGFDEFSPLIQQFIGQLRQKTQVDEIAFVDFDDLAPKQTPYIEYRLYADTEEEIKAMALFAKTSLTKGLTSVACVIPNFSELRPLILKTFTRYLASETLIVGNEKQHRFNLSTGSALADFPMISMALMLLQATVSSQSFTHWSALLRSPFLKASEEEYSQRALFEVFLREQSADYLTLDEFYAHLQREKKCLNLQYPIKHLKEIKLFERGYPSQWAEFFSRQLQAWGWPGERTLNSEEHQTFVRWQALLAEYAGLDLILNQKPFIEAFQQLQHMAQSTMFQAKTDSAPIQILGLLEATGHYYDALWVMGLHDGVWPTPPNPNPFLPIAQQRQFDVPHSSCAREYRFCQQLTSRLCSSASLVILSSPQRCGDEMLRPSPLIMEYSEHKVPMINEILFSEQIYRSQNIESFEDDVSIPLTGEKAQGGAGILRDQAACPFRAFAHYRLGARKLPEVSPYLTAMDRGKIVHAFLEQLWRRLRSQQRLLTCTDLELETISHTIISNALNDFPRLKPSFRQLEHDRLYHLLQRWIDHEKNRPSFEVIACEKREIIEIGPLRLQIQIDRIDQLHGDPDLIMIDYKTGRAFTSNWFGERPDEPQLPLYCIKSTDPIAGIVFAILHPEKMGFDGVSENSSGITGVSTLDELKYDAPATWPELIHQWHEELEQLANEFHQGFAAVRPKKNDTCTHCDLHRLCRVRIT